MPSQAELERPHTVLNILAVSLPDSEEEATQLREVIMQSQRSALAMGGRSEDADQSVPTVGQA